MVCIGPGSTVASGAKSIDGLKTILCPGSTCATGTRSFEGRKTITVSVAASAGCDATRTWRNGLRVQALPAEPPRRRLGPMAAVRWGEASHPGPGRTRRRARRNDDGALEAWRNLVAAYREERTARTRHTQAEWRELIASRRTALRLDLVDRRRAPPAAAAVGQPVAPALCVPVGWSRVSARDNVPHLSDGDGNPYYVTEDGTFWVRRRDSAGVERNIQVAFDEHTHAALVRDFVELGDLVIDCPPPVLVPAGGEPPQEATRGVLSSPPSSAAAAAPPAAPAAPLSASPTSFRPSTPHPTGADHNGPGAETVDEGEGDGGGGVAGRAVEGASKAPEPSVFGRGDEVEHRDVHGDWWPAEVVEVHTREG